MADTRPLVSVGMPTRNGEHRIPAAIESALAQRYENIQVVISDNASTDGTEEVCRALAAADPRIRYHRQPENIGLFNNFIAVMHLAEGELFCWLGDDDEVNPAFIERSAEVLVADPARVLATTGVSWVGPDDSAVVRPYDPVPMDSPDRLARFEHMLKMLNEDAAIDPLASLVRREPVARIPRRNMMREDQVFATQLALAGRWGHVPEVLLSRRWKHETRPDLARYLDVPAWQGRFTTTFQTTQLMRVVSEADFPPLPRWRARGAVIGHHIGWHRRRIVNGIERRWG